MPDQAHTATSSTAQTILAVDDDPAILRLCASILEQAGFTVLTGANSSEALKLCKNHPSPIHLLLTDLVMPPPEFSFASGDNEFPNVHGHELAVRALRMRPDLRVILMSQNIEQELAGYGLRLGPLASLPKPFEAPALLTLVRQTLQTPPLSVESLMPGPLEVVPQPDEWAG